MEWGRVGWIGAEWGGVGWGGVEWGGVIPVSPSGVGWGSGQVFLSVQHVLNVMSSLVGDSGGLDGPDSLESYMKTLDQRLSKSDKYEMRQRIHHMRKVGVSGEGQL